MKEISWAIPTGPFIVEQKRKHHENYFDKVTVEQSKYIALHVGIFWSIGTFLIKNEDTVNVMLDSKSMYEHLIGNTETPDLFIEKRTEFIKQLIAQRKLYVRYHLIEPKDNLASKLL